MKQQQKFLGLLLAAAGLLILPLVLQGFGNAWVRIADMALLFVLLSLGLNIVVGYAGLLDLGYVAFFAIGAYMYGLMSSPHLTDTFPALAAMFPNGMHTPLIVVVPLAAGLAGVFGVLLGAPTLRLRGDYLACQSFDMRDRLHKITAPALIIAATDDRMVHLSFSETLAGRIPRAALVVIQGAGHMLPLERPAEVARAVTEWLEAGQW